MLAEIAILRERRRRSNCEPEQLRALLIATGANILEFRAVSRIIPMPFAGLRPLPALYEIRAKHDQRCGCWYVRTASGSAGPGMTPMDTKARRFLNSAMPCRVTPFRSHGHETGSLLVVR